MPSEPPDDARDELREPEEAGEEALRDEEARALAASGPGSGLLAPEAADADQDVSVAKVCPQCATEYETSARFCPHDGTALRPKGSDTLIGRVLADRYHILKRIGEGGMGRVYLGEHVKMNRPCAIKVMSPALVNDGESTARFAREASNAARITHPNVAAVFDYGESEDVVYLVMEYVDGEALSRLLTREAPLALERALDLAGQIADGLGAAHELGIVHRDLKPDNILITRTLSGREVAKVVDFGIAKAVQDAAHQSLTRTGQVIGTPEFMSPEQLLGDPVDARSDLYALGCIFHLMLTATPPFQASTREQMIKRRLSEDAPHIRSVDEGLPDSVAGIVAKLLARAPGDRYGSAAEVHDALRGTHARRVVPSSALSRPTPRSAPTVAFLRATQATTEVTSVPPVAPVRRARLAIAGGAVIAVVAALLVRGTPSPVQSERATNAERENTLAAAVRAAPAAVIPSSAASVTPGATVPMVDSARLNTLREQKHVRDSVARAAAMETGALRSAIVRYAHAIESGDVALLRQALPFMTGKQQEAWEKNFFARASHIAAAVKYGPSRTVRDSAEVDFSMVLTMTDRSSSQVTTTQLRQHATLARSRGAWQIVGLR